MARFPRPREGLVHLASRPKTRRKGRGGEGGREGREGRASARGHVDVWTPPQRGVSILGELLVQGISPDFLLFSVKGLVAHHVMTRNRAGRRAGRLQPFARGPDGVAARLALALEQPRSLLPGRGRQPAGVEAGVGRGPAAARMGATSARKAALGVVARIGPTRPSPSATRLNGFPCPTLMPTAAGTSS